MLNPFIEMERIKSCCFYQRFAIRKTKKERTQVLNEALTYFHIQHYNKIYNEYNQYRLQTAGIFILNEPFISTLNIYEQTLLHVGTYP